jgi:hypothetical protein
MRTQRPLRRRGGRCHGATSPETWARTAEANADLVFQAANYPNPGQFRTGKSLELTFFSFSEFRFFNGLHRLPGHFFFPGSWRWTKIIIVVSNLRQATRQRSPPWLLADRQSVSSWQNHHSKSFDFPEAIVSKKPDSQFTIDAIRLPRVCRWRAAIKAKSPDPNTNSPVSTGPA